MRTGLAIVAKRLDTGSVWVFHSEIGDLSGDQLGPAPLFRYFRGDVILERDWLKQKLGLTISGKELKALLQIDRPEYAKMLLELGRAAAAKQVQPEHLALPLEPSLSNPECTVAESAGT